MLTIDEEIELQRMVRRTILRAPRPEDVRCLQPLNSREREGRAGYKNEYYDNFRFPQCADLHRRRGS